MVTLLKCVVRCPVRISVEISAAVIGFSFFQTVQANVSILTDIGHGRFPLYSSNFLVNIHVTV